MCGLRSQKGGLKDGDDMEKKECEVEQECAIEFATAQILAEQARPFGNANRLGWTMPRAATF